jgi:molybdenum cofactor cytidylyltransferase
VLGAVILAAGESRRMGSPKAMLPDRDGTPFVVRGVRTLRAAGLTDVVVVTGGTHDEVVGVLERELPGTRVVRNPAPGRGQLSSLLTGLDALEQPELEGVLVTLVDVPFCDPSTVRAVIAAWRATGKRIVRPALGPRHGHPVLFDRGLFAALRAAPLEEGAKHVLRAHAAHVENVAVDDEGCLVDIDTPDDYRRTTA